MAKQTLKHKATTSMIWTGIEKYLRMFISFISGIILARLLTPFDYGCIGMLTIFMVLADSFIDGGFGSALIQKKKPTQTDYSTIFWWNIFMAALMYVILFLTAPAIARFYNIPLLSNVLRVQGLVLFFHALNLVQINQLRKKLNFKVISITSIATSVIALSATIVMAYSGFGVWALVAQNLLTSVIPAIVYWFYVRWRPLFTFSFQSFKELFNFGFFMFLTHLINNFGQQVQGLLIGKMYNPTTMGYYSKAVSAEKLASQSISQVMTSVTYPLYAEVQDDRAKMANIIRRLTMTLAFATFPLMFVLILCAEPIFVLLYSDRWINSVPYFQVLCLTGFGACLIAVNTQPIAAIGKSKTMFLWTLLKRFVGIGSVVAGMLLWGMKGLLLGVVINVYFSYAVNIGLVSKHIGYKWYRQLLDLLPITIAGIVAAVASFGIGYLCHLSLYPDGILKAVVCISIYLLWALLFKPEAYTYFLTVIPQKFRFWERKNR